jgi:enamine deaminase RidA (YjgF/YER057c/UK114 family)
VAERQDIIPQEMKIIHEKSRYTPGVRVGNMLYIAGQVGRDAEWNTIEGVEEQITKAFENVKLVLEEAGASFDNVVDLRTYHTDVGHLRRSGAARVDHRDQRGRLSERLMPRRASPVGAVACPGRWDRLDRMRGERQDGARPQSRE